MKMTRAEEARSFSRIMESPHVHSHRESNGDLTGVQTT